MIPIPAIDLKNGKVVRLLQGKFEEEKIYDEDPAVVAGQFEKEGASRLHVVDLDGALGGMPKNKNLVERILGRVSIPVEVGGGVRDLKTADNYFTLGARWVILGTRASLDKGFLKEALLEFKEKVIVGIDAADGLIATDGWTRITSIKALELAGEVEALGGKTVIYTDISKDGMLAGPSVDQIKTLSRTVSISVIASGGVAALDHITQLIALKQKNIIGVIIGKALYENKFKLKDAVTLCSQKG